MTTRKRDGFKFGTAPALALALALALAAGACSHVASTAYNGPGWYLEKPYLIAATAPQVYGGPFSYEECEAARTRLEQPTADRMLCLRHLARPTFTGPYRTDIDMRGKLAPAPANSAPSATTTAPAQPTE